MGLLFKPTSRTKPKNKNSSNPSFLPEGFDGLADEGTVFGGGLAQGESIFAFAEAEEGGGVFYGDRIGFAEHGIEDGDEAVQGGGGLLLVSFAVPAVHFAHCEGKDI